MAVISFLLFIGALGLLAWRPEGTATTGLRMLVWAVLSFLSGIAFLFALFTVWWPPTQLGSVIWSAAAVAVLAFIAVSNTQPTDWMQ